MIMTKIVVFTFLFLLLWACASNDSNWDSGASKRQSDHMEDNSNLQQTMQNQAPAFIPP